MDRKTEFAALMISICLTSIGGPAVAQNAAPSPAPAPAQTVPNAPRSTAPISEGGMVQGMVQSGNTPLPGVEVTATNTLTGQRYATVTDIRGTYGMRIPKDGRYVVRVELPAFAAQTKEVLLNASNRQQRVDYAMVLESRASRSGRPGATGAMPSASQLRALGTLAAAAGSAQAAGMGNIDNGPSLASAARNSDIATQSVAVQGQTGTVNPFANIDQSQLQQRLEDMRAQRALSQVPGQGGGRGRGGFRGGGGGGFFRHFNPTQPHGSIFYRGENSALDAAPFSVTGAPIVQPPYNANTAGIVFIGPPQIPHLLKPSTSNFLFIGAFLTRNSLPFNQYAIVPTLAERGGNFSDYTANGKSVVPIYDPATGTQFSGNMIPNKSISPQARALLQYIPVPNQPGLQNFRYLTTSQTNQSRIGARLVHNFGSGGGGAALPPFLRGLMGSTSHGLSQNVNANFNFSHSASDLLNVFPQLGGSDQTYQYSLNLGYDIGYNRWTNNVGASLNRTNSQLRNFFTGKTDVAAQAGIQGLGSDPFNYGVPNIVFSQFQGVSEQAPDSTINQTLVLSDTASWMGKKHNVRFGGDYRRIHFDVEGGSATNVTGSFYFTGFATRQPGSSGVPGQQPSGSDFADFLLGLPQEATIQQGVGKFYFDANVFDLFVQDDWHPLPNFTVNYGLRYEYFSPYTEQKNRLTNLAFTPTLDQLAVVLPNGTSAINGKYPASLVYPDRKDLGPRLGFAWRATSKTVVRAGYGINFNTGQYANFVQNLAYQPPFANTRTNIIQPPAAPSLTMATALTHTTTPTGITNNYAVNKNYLLGYVQVWDLGIQNTLPLAIVLNVGYSGAKGTHLDLVDAPNRQVSGLLNPAYPSFFYEDSVAFSNYNAFTVRAYKRLQRGISLGATYIYSHSIDNASSIGQSGTVVAQNQQDLLAEEGNSAFDVRHQVSGNWLYELPFGPNTRYMSGGSALSHALSNLSVSGSFDFATGVPLSPRYQAASGDVARGSAGSQRPNRVPGSSLTAGGGTLRRWFNTDAFAPPVNPVTGAPEYGNASRNSIPGPGTVETNMALSKTVHLGSTRSFEFRGSANNVFNTVQYSSVDSFIDSPTRGQVTSAGTMRQITFMLRFRY